MVVDLGLCCGVLNCNVSTMQIGRRDSSNKMTEDPCSCALYIYGGMNVESGLKREE